MHKLTTYDDEVIWLSDEQAAKVSSAMKAGMKYLTIDGKIIAVGNVASLLVQESIKNTTNTGKLYDGSLVKRHFGEWRDLHDPEVRIDPAYYPEIATDSVPSIEDFDKFIAPLPLEERKLAMLRLSNPSGDDSRTRAIKGSAFSSLRESLKEIKTKQELEQKEIKQIKN